MMPARLFFYNGLLRVSFGCEPADEALIRPERFRAPHTAKLINYGRGRFSANEEGVVSVSQFHVRLSGSVWCCIQDVVVEVTHKSIHARGTSNSAVRRTVQVLMLIWVARLVVVDVMVSPSFGRG